MLIIKTPQALSKLHPAFLLVIGDHRPLMMLLWYCTAQIDQMLFYSLSTDNLPIRTKGSRHFSLSRQQGFWQGLVQKHFVFFPFVRGFWHGCSWAEFGLQLVIVVLLILQVGHGGLEL